MNAARDYKEEARAFLRAHPASVLSTVTSDGKPQAAVIYTIVDDNFNFFFITKSDTAKARNIENNKNVALTVMDLNNLATVQVNGIIRNMERDEDYVAIFSKTAQAGDRYGFQPMSKLNSVGDNVLYKLEPQWLRYGDFSEGNGGAEATKNVFHQIIPDNRE